MPYKIAHYGWIPDLPDQRDFQYAAPPEVIGALPASADLTSACPPVYDQGQLGSCFPAGTPILLADGTERAIEEIGSGQPVITHCGNEKRVERVYERIYTGRMYTIAVQGWQYPLQMTAEHPVAVVPNEHTRAKYGAFTAGEIVWTQAQYLQPGDFVLMPYGKEETLDYARVDVRDYISAETWSDGEVCRVCTAPVKHTIPRLVPINERFAQLIGLFLAEGSYSKGIDRTPHRLVWTFARHEQAYQQFVVDALAELFGVQAYVVHPEKRPTVSQVKCDNTTLASFIHTFCGEHSYRKEVNPLFFSSPREVKIALLRGWLMGDGTQHPLRTTKTNGESYEQTQIEGATSSEALHKGMFRIATSCRMKPGAHIRKQQEYQGAIPRALVFYGPDVLKVFPEHAAILEQHGIVPNPLLTRYKPLDLGFACRIASVTIEEVEELRVYNLEVEDDHTYVANGIAVHNCTANAIAGAIEFDQMKQNLSPVFVPSRLFIYYNERVIEGTVNTDSGAQLRDGMKSAGTQGVCPEDMWPYNIANFEVQPTDDCYQAALQHKAILYQRVTRNLDQMKGCLASGYPFVFGFTVYESFESKQVAQSGHAPMPQPGEQTLGGHAVLAVGYDDANQWFIARNSWGTGWGMQGYFTLPYAYLASRSLSSDFWTVRVVQ